MKKEIRITIGHDRVEVAAFCLTTDSWQDHQHFFNEAKAYAAANRLRDQNRALRAALLFLFAHLEGVVDHILEKNGLTQDGDRLCDKTRLISRSVPPTTRLPYLNFRIGKALRDILVHPGIEKFAEGVALDETSVYDELTIETVEKLSKQIDFWLSAACRALGVERFTDTKKMASMFGDALGEAEIREV